MIHRDMKSSNVLVNKEGILKLADFGLSRPISEKRAQALTNRVVTLWYRAPELLLGERLYSGKIDIWGAGCIMAEMWTRHPILQGSSEQRQLVLISALCGSISSDCWPDVCKLQLYGKMHLEQGLPRRVCVCIFKFFLFNFENFIYIYNSVDLMVLGDQSNETICQRRDGVRSSGQTVDLGSIRSTGC